MSGTRPRPRPRPALFWFAGLLVGAIGLLSVTSAGAVGHPTVSALSVHGGSTAGGTPVTITGTGFTGATAVKFGATNQPTFTVVDDTTITTTSPAQAAGTVQVIVTRAMMDSTANANTYFVYAPTPVVTSISPTTGSQVGGTSVTINGTGLTNATSVTFGGSVATIVTNSNDTQMTVTSPAHAVGVVDVQVTTVGGTSATSAADQFTYTAAPVPVVTEVSPNSGSTAGGTAVTITGTGFIGATAVKFGGVPATAFTVNSATSISATSPDHAVGVVDVQVTTVGGTSATSAADRFTYTAAPVPVVTSISPNSGSTAGGTEVSITGTGFIGATAVKFGGVPATAFTVNSATSISATSPAQAAGTVVVIVSNDTGDSTANANTYFVYAPRPVVTSISPNSGSTAGGTEVTITGTGFTGATAVSFGGTPAASFTVVSNTSMTAVSPAHAAGTVNVFVTAPGGANAATTGNQFTYTTGIAVTGVSPASGPPAGGTAVMVTGFGFNGATSVTFGGTAATNLVVVSDTTITVTSPAHTSGTVDVIVTATAGTSAVNAGAKFVYTGTAVTGVSPNSGPIAGGTAVTITGGGFTGATSVTFGGVAATNLVVVNDTSITVTSPAHASGVVDVVVVSPSGTSPVVTADKFTYTGGTVSYTLSFRWSIIVWRGADGISAKVAITGLESPDDPATNNVSAIITAIDRWNGTAQKWEAYFPGSDNVPGANDFTVLNNGTAYFIAVTTATTWTAAGS
ncbi:MAG: IPT/TIG domain-containing protein [Chloroflexi bacterium]|nr:IPT/TIG domain-containing protein [Chloroflexota bacterium]